MLNLAKELLAIAESHGTIHKFRFSSKAENKWDNDRVSISGSLEGGAIFELTLTTENPEEPANDT